LSLTKEALQQALEERSLARFFNDSSLGALLRFTDQMLEINQTLNLTKWTNEEEVLNFHLLDSAVSLPLIEELTQGKAGKWLDIGSGCGFPGALVMGAFPGLKVTLLDSVGKKVNALRLCIQAAGWKGEARQARAEELGRNPQTRELWEGVTARAVAALPELLEYAIPLLKIGGYLVNWMTEEQMKSVDKSKNALQILQSNIVKTVNYSIPGFTQPRTLLVVEKLGKTPEPYPRPSGQISKRPL
jgi:16S rRNA (guanine527-N7)-methyltransferase